MALFSNGIPRWLVLLLALAALCAIPPDVLARGPNLCLWRHLFRLSACPACGSTRALAAFFHGQFALALAFNRNVLFTAPGLIILLALDILQLAERLLKRSRSVLLQVFHHPSCLGPWRLRSGLNFRLEANKFFTIE